MTQEYRDNKRLAHRLYLLMIEANCRLSENEKNEIGQPDITDDDPEIIFGLQFIRRKNLIAKSELNKYYQKEAEKILSDIENEYTNIDDFVNQLINAPESEQLVAMFRNFNSLSENDKKQMLIDSKLLGIIQKLKEKKDDASRNT